MKIAVSAEGGGLDAQVSPVFGRCRVFVIVETEGNTIKSHKDLINRAAMQAGSAGVMSAEITGNEGTEAVISGAIGPRAFTVLSQMGIRMYISQGGKVRDNVIKLLDGKLGEIRSPGMPGFGAGRMRGGPGGPIGRGGFRRGRGPR